MAHLDKAHSASLAVAPVAREVDVHLVDPEREVDADAAARCSSVLSSDERARAARFAFERDRVLFVTARGLLRLLLSAMDQHVRPADWRFVDGPFGRPQLVSGPLGLSFSVSHTAGAVAVAMARGRALGVDVERVDAGRSALDLARRYFAPSEAGALELVAAGSRGLRFCGHWTLKEAYAKARGLGLHLPLDLCTVHFEDEEARVRLSPGAADDEARWAFALRRIGEHHVLAVAAERSGEEPLLRLWRTVPGHRPELVSTEAFS